MCGIWHPRRGFTSLCRRHNKDVYVSPQNPILANAKNLWELVKPSTWDHFLAHLREDFKKFPLCLSPIDKTQGKIALEEKMWQKSAVSDSCISNDHGQGSVSTLTKRFIYLFQKMNFVFYFEIILFPSSIIILWY